MSTMEICTLLMSAIVIGLSIGNLFISAIVRRCADAAIKEDYPPLFWKQALAKARFRRDMKAELKKLVAS